MSRVASFGQISEISEHLYLSGAHVLRPETLRARRIGCVINATADDEFVGRLQAAVGVDYEHVPVEDARDAPLHAHFDRVADKIRQVKQQRGMATLVHCVAGVSRSATLCIAYLVKHEGMTLRQAYWRVKQARPIIRPNNGFWVQLVEFELKIRGSTSVSMVHSLHGYDRYDKPLPDLYAVADGGCGAIDDSDSRRRRHLLTAAVAFSASSTPQADVVSDNVKKNEQFLMDIEKYHTRHNSAPDHYRRYSSSVDSSPRSSLAGRMAERYGRGGARKKLSAPPTFSALTLANCVVPLKSHIKASLFSSICETGFQPSLNDILFPIF